MDGTLWTINKLIVVNINVAARRLGIRQHIYGRQFFHSTLGGGLARKRKSIINFKDCLVMITINSILISTTDTRSSAQAQQQGAEEKFHYKNWQTENLIFTQRPFSDRLMPHHEKCRQRRVSKVMKRKKFISEKFLCCFWHFFPLSWAQLHPSCGVSASHLLETTACDDFLAVDIALLLPCGVTAL